MPRPVIVISSINLDTTLTVPRFPSPGETLHSSKTTTSLGGKGANVSIAAAHATKNVYLISAIGPDATAEETALRSHQVNTTYLKRTNTPTGRALILLNQQGDNCIIVSKGANALLTADLPREVEALMTGAFVVLQLEIEHGVTQQIAVRARELGATVVLNPSPVPGRGSLLFKEDARVWRAVGVVILNALEVEQITGIGRSSSRGTGERTAEGEVDMVSAYRAAIEKMSERCGDKATVLVTLGEEGVVYLRDGAVKHMGAFRGGAVVDTTGAGDTFTGFLVGCMAEGLAFEECLRVAAVAAGLCVQRDGAADSIPLMREVGQCLVEWERR